VVRKSSIYLLFFIAVSAWIILLLFTRFVAPSSLFAFCVFFLIFSIALSCTFAPIIYSIELRVFPKYHFYLLVRYALRQSALLTTAIVLNLIFLVLHTWNIVMALIILLAAVILEILFLARK
jgi:hypothetical protein